MHTDATFLLEDIFSLAVFPSGNKRIILAGKMTEGTLLPGMVVNLGGVEMAAAKLEQDNAEVASLSAPATGSVLLSGNTNEAHLVKGKSYHFYSKA